MIPEKFIDSLKQELAILIIPWREVWKEYRDLPQRRRKYQGTLLGECLWNEEQKVAKLNIWKIDIDLELEIVYATVNLFEDYPQAIVWAMEEIEMFYVSYTT